MKIVAAIADDNCIVIEEGTSTSSTKQPGTENMLWKKFDQRVVDLARVRTTTVGTLVEKQQYLQHANIDHHKPKNVNMLLFLNQNL